MKKISVLWTCLFLIFNCGGLILTSNVSGGSPPPPDDGIDGLQYIDGDWTVTGTESYTNETIVLTGNLTVENGGQLTFNNVTLKLNCSENGTYHINVTSGGSFYIYDLDNDNTTTEDASVITSNYSDGMHRFLFWVRKDANFTMKNSELHECGYTGGAGKRGLEIETENITFKNNLISYNYLGVWLATSNVTLSNNTITSNDDFGVVIFKGTNVSIIQNRIVSNSFLVGLNVYSSSRIFIIDNNISLNRNGMNIEWSDNVTVSNNSLFGNWEDGIWICSSTATIEDVIISNQQYGIPTTAGSGPIYLINSSISSSSTYDIDLSGTSHIITLNSIFNSSKTHFDDYNSDLSIKWFLDTKVENITDFPISGATVRVQDNVNGTFDENYTTDVDGWARWIVVTERVLNKSGNVSYTPHNITVSKSGYSDGYAEVNMNESKEVTITLQPTTEYKSGDWIVTTTEIHSNKTIILTGNLTIMPTGNLTFNNVTLKMNCSVNGSYHINVTSGGSFYIYDLDNDNTTTEDASVITSNYSDGMRRFHFWVKKDANFTMVNSELHECGERDAPNPNNELGLYIEANNTIIHHSLFSNNEFGMFIVASNVTISNNTIENNSWVGLWVYQTSNVTIENNIVKWHPLSSGIYIRSSFDILVEDSTFFENGNGISIDTSSNITLSNNSLFSSFEDGIAIAQSNVVISDTTIQNQLYGIVLTVVAGPILLINSSISNSSGLGGSDVIITSNSQIVSLNSTFNSSKVTLLGADSLLTVQWFAHIKVENTTGFPIPGATVRVQDNANGTFDENYTTYVDGWARWIAVTERVENTSGNVYYTPHNITASKAGYLDGCAVPEPNMNESRSLTITLVEPTVDEKPVADAGLDQSANEDQIVYFDGSGSTDDVGIVWYNWSFGDGSYNNGTNITLNHVYTNTGTYVVTLNVTDTIGQWDADTCLIFVNNVGPTADAGGNQIVSEGEDLLFDGSASTDTPSDQANLIYTWYFGDGDSDTGMYASHIYEDNGTYTATLIVTDDNGFVDSDSILVNVNNVAPSIEAIEHQYIFEDEVFRYYVSASDAPGDTLTFSDNTALFDIDPMTGLIEFIPTNDDVGNHSVNITVADDDGGVNYTILNITVVNTNDAPALDPISQQSAVEDVEFSLEIDANDVDVSDVLTFSLTTYPPGMNIDGATGIITWMPTNDDIGEHTITVKVEDKIGAFDTDTFTIIVSNVNDAPTIITISLAIATEDMFYMAYIQGNDVDAGDTLTYSLDTSPAFISINPLNGLIFGTPTNVDVGTHSVTVNVTDGDVYVTKTFSLNVVNTNDAPTITSTPILTTDVGVEYAYDVVAVDEDNDVLTFSLIEAPEGMAINGTKITWIPTNAQEGKTYQVVVEVTDGEATTTQSFIIYVGEIPEKTNYWLPLLLGLVGGLISGIFITLLMDTRRRNKKEEMLESKDEL